MDRNSKSELLKKIETQQGQLQRYETRLRDVVVAYKGLFKEKEALEASLNALSTSETPIEYKQKELADVSSKDVENKDTTDGDPLGATTTEESPDQDKETISFDSNAEIQRLKEKITTLTSSLSTLSTEKTKSAASYKEEKKQLRQQFEEQIQKLTKERDNANDIAKEMQEQILELKSKILVHQHEREKEQSDHGLVLREMQAKISQARFSKETVEHQLDDLKMRLAEKENVTVNIAEQYENKVKQLSNELDAVRARLKSSEDKANEPSPLLLELKKEMSEIKAQHRIQVQQEQFRANEAEERVELVAAQSENRVSNLEEKISELSIVVGNYEKTRNHDQQAIQKLRERVQQLDMENTALARAANSTGGSDVSSDNDDDRNLDVHSLVEKITKLKGLLKLANERSEHPILFEDLLHTCDVNSEEEAVHKRCNEELSQLKEEFERYKLRAQSVLKNKSTKDLSSNKELESFRHQISDLKDKIKGLYQDADDNELRQKAIVEDLRKTIARLKQQHESDLSTAQSDYQKRASELEKQLHKHRDRTIALLSEKDHEIETLKVSHGGRKYSYEAKIQHLGDSFDDGGLMTSHGEAGSEAMTDIMNKLEFTGISKSDGALLHFANEQARKDVEIHTLRKQKHEFETSLREMQHSTILAEESNKEEVDALKEEVRKLERNKSRESANLEYLKNVVYNYMISLDTYSKQSMLNAISTILEFSPTEKRNVHKAIHSWWGYKPKK